MNNGADRMPTILEVKDLRKEYPGVKAVDGISFLVKQGTCFGLLGPNGAGKTTTFHIITGMISPDKGTVRMGERDLTKLAMYRRARLGVGYLAQEPSVFRKLSVEQNLMAILEMMPLRKADRKIRMEELLMEFSIAHLAKQRADTLSGGERRRLEIARSLVTRPKFILLDEPFAGIDPIAVIDIQEIVKDLKERGIGVLITDHNVHETLSITDRAYLLYDGQILKSGTSEELVSDEMVRKLYLGRNFELR